MVARRVRASARPVPRMLEGHTHGGVLLDSTRQIVQSCYGAKRPVVVYVAPAGAIAGSAGVFITLAADVAAMAPHTSIDEALEKKVIDRQTDPWGIKVTAVEVKDVVLPEAMRRAMARQAEIERERRAKVINAEGEFQAAEKLVQAAAKISAQPVALQLRFLKTVSEIGKENATTAIIPLPLELFGPYLENAATKNTQPPEGPFLPASR